MRSRSHLVTLAVQVCLATAVVLPASSAAATNGKIVFQGGTPTGKHPQVFSINSDGTGLKQLTHAKGDGAENPVWSPDGSAIAFDVGAEKRADVFTALPDGTGVTRLSLGASKFHGDPAYSPDGSQISFDEDSTPGHPRATGSSWPTGTGAARTG